MNRLIAVSIGDINGIGLEIYIKLLIKREIKNVVLFTDYKYIKKYLIKNKYKIKINDIKGSTNNYKNNINFLNIFSFKSNSNEENTLKSIKFSHEQCILKNYIGLITLPLRKDLIIKKALSNFVGHTEFLQDMENKKYTNMILYNKKIIISPLTTHIKINSVSRMISKKNFIYEKIKILNDSLFLDFGLKKPKIIVSGLNPHAGENGNIGNEDEKIIKPAIHKLKKNNIHVKGPVSADSMLIDKNINHYDCFVFMYHDQALIPFKYISKFSGVNFTSNLNIIRTSPDHGTAYNMRGKNKISNLSLKNCFKLILKIYENRKKNKKSKKIIKSKFS